MSQPILVIMAAGMGSRFGGLKQIQPVGPNGEIILDYSINDAYNAGFRKAVFVIKEENYETFSQMTGKIAQKMDIKFAFQNLNDLPDGTVCPPNRVKPWGTGHAVLAAREYIDAPFAVINADDYYGPKAFNLLYDFLSKDAAGKKLTMVAFELKNTVTDHGSVSRGVCEVDQNGQLVGITERTEIIKKDGKLMYVEDGKEYELPEETLVSMNCWGCPQEFIGDLQGQFAAFMDASHENPEKREFGIPAGVDSLMKERGYAAAVLHTPDKWYGITYKEDVPVVIAAMKEISDTNAI